MRTKRPVSPTQSYKHAREVRTQHINTFLLILRLDPRSSVVNRAGKITFAWYYFLDVWKQWNRWSWVKQNSFQASSTSAWLKSKRCSWIPINFQRRRKNYVTSPVCQRPCERVSCFEKFPKQTGQGSGSLSCPVISRLQFASLRKS